MLLICHQKIMLKEKSNADYPLKIISINSDSLMLSCLNILKFIFILNVKRTICLFNFINDQCNSNFFTWLSNSASKSCNSFWRTIRVSFTIYPVFSVLVWTLISILSTKGWGILYPANLTYFFFKRYILKISPIVWSYKCSMYVDEFYIFWSLTISKPDVPSELKNARLNFYL